LTVSNLGSFTSGTAFGGYRSTAIDTTIHRHMAEQAGRPKELDDCGEISCMILTSGTMEEGIWSSIRTTCHPTFPLRRE